MRQLVESPALRTACPVPFDEGRIWQGKDGGAALEELRANFRNVSAVLDCVGCEKCRLWGKLQFLGLGTALKILFSLNPGSECPELQRNEVIALVNLLHRLSESLKVNREFAAALRSGATVDDAAFAAHDTAGLPSFLL
jgi:ERO1-like protein alpha